MSSDQNVGVTTTPTDPAPVTATPAGPLDGVRVIDLSSDRKSVV